MMFVILIHLQLGLGRYTFFIFCEEHGIIHQVINEPYSPQSNTTILLICFNKFSNLIFLLVLGNFERKVHK